MTARGTTFRLAMVACTAITLFFVYHIVSFSSANRRMSGELEEIRDEADRRMGIQRSPSQIVVVQAPFATWAELVRAVHRAGTSAGLQQFDFETGGVVPLADADVPLRIEDATPTEEPDASVETAESESPRSDPYRAMTAVVRGRGSYEAIGEFARRLVDGDAVLSLDRLEVVARPGAPEFEALVHLTTSLPVESPSSASRAPELVPVVGGRAL